MCLLLDELNKCCHIESVSAEQTETTRRPNNMDASTNDATKYTHAADII